MTDIVTVGLGVDTSSVVRANAEMVVLGRTLTNTEKDAIKLGNAIRGVERDIRTLNAPAEKAAKEALKATKDWFAEQRRILDLQKGSLDIANKQAIAEEKIAKETAKRTQEIIKQRDAQAAADAVRASDYQNRINTNLGVNQGSGGADSAAAYAAQIERLQGKFQSFRAASQLYETELRDLNSAYALGVIGVKNYEASLESLNVEFQQFQNGQARSNNIFEQQVQGMGMAANRANKYGVAIQQTGYQVGDFLVQIQSGTNWMVAFGQQATQLVGILPELAGPLKMSVGSLVAISAGLGIAIPLITALGAAWFRSSEESRKGAEKQKQAIDSIVEATKRLRIERQMGLTGALTPEDQTVLNEQNALLKERLEILDQIAKARSQEQVVVSGGRSQLSADNLVNQRESLRLQIEENQKKIDALEYERNLNIAEKRRANERRNDYREAKKDATDLYNKLFSASKIDLGSVFSEAGPFAQNLLNKVNGIVDAMNKIGNPAAASVKLGAGGRPEINLNNMDYRGAVIQGRLDIRDKAAADAEAAAKVSGGGSSATDSIESLRSQYESLMGSFDPLIAAQNTYNNQLEDLDKALKKGAISGKEYETALALIKNQLEEAKDPLNAFKQQLEDALDPNKNYMKGLQALQSSLADFLFNPFEVGLDGMVLSFSRALQRMASEALAAGFMKMLLGGLGGGAGGGIGGAITSFLGGSANGNAFSNGNYMAFANGGVVGGPTLFPMRGGTGLMGEAGPEAIMPLKRGANGKLGVQMDGGSSGGNTTKIINVLDPSIVGEYLNTPDGEEVIMNVMRRTGVV